MIYLLLSKPTWIEEVSASHLSVWMLRMDVKKEKKKKGSNLIPFPLMQTEKFKM